MNSLAAIIELFKADSAIAALVSTRVYYGNKVKITPSSFPCILVSRAAGTVDDDEMPVVEPMFDVRCYGSTQVAAEQVADAIRSSLHGKTRLQTTNYFFHYVRIINGPMDASEQVSNSQSWDCCYLSLMAEIE